MKDEGLRARTTLVRLRLFWNRIAFRKYIPISMTPPNLAGAPIGHNLHLKFGF